MMGPFSSHEELYAVIDEIKHGDVPWKCFTVKYAGEVLPSDPSWKFEEHEIWYQDPDAVIASMLDNPDFDGEFDYAPYVGLDTSGQRVLNDFMSANYAYRKSVSD